MRLSAAAQPEELEELLAPSSVPKVGYWYWSDGDGGDPWYLYGDVHREAVRVELAWVHADLDWEEVEDDPPAMPIRPTNRCTRDVYDPPSWAEREEDRRRRKVRRERLVGVDTNPEGM